MGTDIHFYVEVPGPEGKWVLLAPPPGVDRFADSHGSVPTWFQQRSYKLFAWLAGVRRDECDVPLLSPKGLPDGLCEILREESEFGHSASWFYAEELLRAIPEQVRFKGIVSEVDYIDWKRSGQAFPAQWCRDVNRPFIGESDYAAGVRSHGEETFIACHWCVSAKQCFSEFVATLKRVMAINPRSRCVFWFDS